MPGDIKNVDDESDDLDTNVFDLFPDPVHFVEFLKNIDRGDIASSIFIKLLENYRDMKGRTNEDPMKYVPSEWHPNEEAEIIAKDVA